MVDTDYTIVETPETLPPTEYSCEQRRSEMLQMIERAGHPRSLPTKQLSERYGVSMSQISQDKTALQEFIVSQIDETRVDATITTVIESSLEEMVDNGEHRDAVRTALDWAEYLGDRGFIDREPEQHELTGELETTQNVGEDTLNAMRSSVAERYGVADAIEEGDEDDADADDEAEAEGAAE